MSYVLNADINRQTARILISHKGPTWAWEAQVLSLLYVCNNQFDITYQIWFNKYKTKNYQYKWIWVNTDCTFFINDTKAMYASKAQVGPLCNFQILAIWVQKYLQQLHQKYSWLPLQTSWTFYGTRSWMTCIHYPLAKYHLVVNNKGSQRHWKRPGSVRPTLALWVKLLFQCR